MTEQKWKPYPLLEPLPHCRGQKVIAEYIVTVRLDNKDDLDDDETCIAMWYCEDQTFRYILDHKFKYGENGWHVIGFMEKPKPFIPNE